MTISYTIPVYQPSIAGNERQYVLDCIESSWISSKGEYLQRFEHAFSSYTSAQHAIAVSNGTVAIHLALLALGIQPGDEVIVPSFTYVASVNPIAYLGAKPVFVDSHRDSWQLDPLDVQRKITHKTRAIIAVHLYGHPADMPAIMRIARERNLFVIEDCAEAFGSRINNQHVGTFGDVGTFSFYGNKTITTGEGGMVITNNDSLKERCTHLKGQGLAKGRTYWHDIVGYNYRMTNICAAIGLAQIERATDLLSKKKQIALQYDSALAHLPIETHHATNPALTHSYWMYSVLLPENQRDKICQGLSEHGIETRPTFYPVHTMPMYANNGNFPVADELGRRGINLPSWPDLKQNHIDYIADQLGNQLKTHA
jgi:perosamine synthetase